MKILNIEDYPDQLDNILDWREIRESIKDFPLYFPDGRKLFFEQMIIPHFSTQMYNYISTKKKIPSQPEFLEYYTKNNSHFYTPKFFKKYESEDVKQALKARCYYAYPSYIRELEASSRLRDILKTKGITSLFNTKLDSEGIDCLILYNDIKIGLCLRVKSERSDKFSGLKEKGGEGRNKLFDNVEYLYMPNDVLICDKAGRFHLYSDKEFEKIFNKFNIK